MSAEIDDIDAMLASILNEEEQPEPEPEEELLSLDEETVTEEGDGDDPLSHAVEAVEEHEDEAAALLRELLGEDEDLVQAPVKMAPDKPELTQLCNDDEAVELDDLPQEATRKMNDEEMAAAVSNIDFFGPAAEALPSIPMPTFTDDEIAESIDIRNFATLVTLNTARWHAKVKDRKAAKDAAEASGADAAAFEARKRLLVGADEKLKRIHKAIDVARTKHYEMTLPWSTVGIGDIGKRTGGRLLPNTLFMEYTTAMAHCKADMDQALADFIPDYPRLVAIAEQRLGTSFNPSEYPNPASIAAHFDLSFDFHPIPDGGDFKGLQDAQISKLADALERKSRVCLENAMQDAWSRLHETVKHAWEKLADPKAMFHYTMTDKLREQAKLMKHLNVTNDPRIEEVRNMVEKKLTKWDAKDIRKDEDLRKRLAKDAKEIYDTMCEQGK